MNYKEIENLIKVLSDSSLTYLEIEKEGFFIKMGKDLGGVKVQEDLPISTINVMNESKALDDKEEIQYDKKEIIEDKSFNIESIKENKESLHTIESPIVGTFYCSSTPDGEAFVKPGQKVSKGDTLCIIEAMKLMNEINSDVEGVIEEILVKNEDMVEYGQPLFKIKK